MTFAIFVVSPTDNMSLLQVQLQHDHKYLCVIFLLLFCATRTSKKRSKINELFCVAGCLQKLYIFTYLQVSNFVCRFIWVRSLVGTLTLREKRWLRVLESRVLRKMSGSKRDEVRG